MGDTTNKALLIGAVVALGLPFVGQYEGISLVSYLDPVGIPTICEGITSIDGKPVTLGMTATAQQCGDLKAHELAKAVIIVDKLVKYPQPDTRRMALSSFVYNVGPAAFARSLLLRKLNNGDVVGACNELPRWVYANGRKLGGLVRRRKAERAMCLIGTTGPAVTNPT